MAAFNVFAAIFIPTNLSKVEIATSLADWPISSAWTPVLFFYFSKFCMFLKKYIKIFKFSETSANFPQKPGNFLKHLKNRQLGAQKFCTFFKNLQKFS